MTVSCFDFPDSDPAHGWTRDDDGTVWYWTWDGRRIEFRTAGTPVSHPLKRGEPVPDHIRHSAERAVEVEVTP